MFGNVVRTPQGQEYTLIHQLGRGAFGDVALAKDSDGREVVIKTTFKPNGPQDPMRERAYHMELRALSQCSRLERRNDIMRLIDFNKEQMFVVLEYIPDGDLFRWRQEHFALADVEENMRLFATQLLQALLFIHSAGILHRDIKPQNILLRRSALWTPERATQTLLAFEPVLADFGTAAIVAPVANTSTTLSSSPSTGITGGHSNVQPRTGHGVLTSDMDFHNQSFETYAGTNGFMAPEVSETSRNNGKSYTSLSDVWSFGALLISIFVGVRNIKFPIDFVSQLEEHRSSMSPEMSNLLDGMMAKKVENRLTWDQLATHPWFKFPAAHAHEWLMAQENVTRYDAFTRPFRTGKFMPRLSEIPRIDSPACGMLLELLNARYLASSTITALKHLHREWTTDKARFYDLYVKSWDTRLAQSSQDLVLVGPVLSLCTMSSIAKLANSYGPSKVRQLLLLEVVRVCMEKLKTQNLLAHVQAWHLLFTDTRNILEQDSLDLLVEPPLSPVRLFQDTPHGTEISFPALMHATCVLKHNEYLLNDLPLVMQPPEEDDFLPVKKITVSLDGILVGLQELRLVMDYVVTQLPSMLSTSTTATQQPVRSASNSSLPSSSSAAASQSHGHGSLQLDESICKDFIERISRIIQQLPEEVAAMKAKSSK